MKFIELENALLLLCDLALGYLIQESAKELFPFQLVALNIELLRLGSRSAARNYPNSAKCN